MDQQLPGPQFEDAHLRDYLNVLIRRRTIFLITFFSVLVGVALFTFFEPPLYESSATLFVKDDNGKLNQMDDLLSNAAAPVDSELEILKSRSNAERVVSTLHLDWKVEGRSEGLGFTAVEFSSSAREPVYEVQFLGNGRYALKDDDGKLLAVGRDGVLTRGRSVTLLIKDLKGHRGDAFKIALLPFNETVERLRKAIKAVEVGKKTNVISVSYRDQDPVLAKDVVNTLVQAYLDQGIAIKAEEATRTIGFVEEQLKGIKSDLETAETNLQAYKSNSGVVELTAEAQQMITSLGEVEKQKAEITLQRRQVEFALAALGSARRRGAVYSPAILKDDPLVAGLATRLADLEVQKRGLMSDTTDVHPGVRAVQAQIEEVQKKLQSTYETALAGILRQEENLSHEIVKHDSQLKRLPVAERDLARLMRLSKVNADIYTFLLQKHEEARIAKASTISNIKVIDPAIVAEKPIFPNKKKNLMLGIMVGMLLGVLSSFFMEYLDDTLKDPEEAKLHLSMPLLALIPYISAKRGSEAMVSYHSPKAPASEAFRSLRTALHYTMPTKQKQVMLVTSALCGEGKSTIACNLAISLAQTGSRVLIVDCDLRRSVLHERLGAKCEEGLTEVLAGDVSHGCVLQGTVVENLDLVAAGAAPPNPSELLGSESMASFINAMRARYAHIIIDAPPVLSVTDPAVLAALADLVVVVVQAGKVPVKAARRAREMLGTMTAPVAGMVLIDTKSGPARYEYGYQYGYAEKKKWWGGGA